MFLYFYNVAYALIYIKYASIHMKFISHYFTYSNKKKKKKKKKKINQKYIDTLNYYLSNLNIIIFRIVM